MSYKFQAFHGDPCTAYYMLAQYGDNLGYDMYSICPLLRNGVYRSITSVAIHVTPDPVEDSDVWEHQWYLPRSWHDIFLDWERNPPYVS